MDEWMNVPFQTIHEIPPFLKDIWSTFKFNRYVITKK